MYANRYKRSYKKRAMRRGGGKKGGYSGAGSARHLLPALRPPPIPKFERQLDKFGLPIQRFRQFRSEERVNVTPTSGKCFWYGVPEFMDYGNPMSISDRSGDTEVKAQKQSPNTCDLYDIYRNLGAEVTTGTSGSMTDSRLGVGFKALEHGVKYYYETQGTQSTNWSSGGTYLYDMAPAIYRKSKPGLDYTMRTQITYDNVSSLDAFVEVYCLEYRRPRSAMGDKTPVNIGLDVTSFDYELGNLQRTPLQWRYAKVHPGPLFTPVQKRIETVSGTVTTYSTSPGMKRQQSALFAGCMLRQYAQAVLFQRDPAWNGKLGTERLDEPGTVDIGPADESLTRNSLGLGGSIAPEREEQVVGHPKNDPLRCCPPKRPTTELGFRMTRVKGVHVVKPGHSTIFHLPNHGTRHWDYISSPVGSMSQDQKAQFTGEESTDTAPIHHAKIYLFRVWGEMIHNKNDQADGREDDFQPGSTSLTFQTQRVCWARLKTRHIDTVNPMMMPFDAGGDIAPSAQEFINPETGAPALVYNMGDD